MGVSRCERMCLLEENSRIVVTSSHEVQGAVDEEGDAQASGSAVYGYTLKSTNPFPAMVFLAI